MGCFDFTTFDVRVYGLLSPMGYGMFLIGAVSYLPLIYVAVPDGVWDVSNQLDSASADAGLLSPMGYGMFPE